MRPAKMNPQRKPKTNPTFSCTAIALLFAFASLSANAQVTAPQPATPVSASTGAPAADGTKGKLVVLDHVVAAINGDVILDSDVQEEMRFAVLQPYRTGAAQNSARSALQRLIDRDLILQQMKATQATLPVPSNQQIQQQLDALRKQIPECVQYHCETEAGWNSFLNAHGLTEQEVEEHWRQRMMILSFIQSRFGAGIRISQVEIEEYYNKDFVPEFVRRKLQPPPLKAVSSRISEILLQQHVTTFLQDWLQSLKSEGNVSILSAAYSDIGDPTGAPEEDTGDEQP
jgi:peptidyl-prolyl cis-trans isomerase SurA